MAGNAAALCLFLRPEKERSKEVRLHIISTNSRVLAQSQINPLIWKHVVVVGWKRVGFVDSILHCEKHGRFTVACSP